jgi:hypothetical protein
MISIGSSLRQLLRNVSTRSVAPCRDILTDAFITAQACALGMVWRNRLFNPLVTILGCIHAHLGDVKSVRVVEDWINSFHPSLPRPADGSAFAKARLRLPLALFRRCSRHVADAAMEAASLTAFGLQVIAVDGTSLRMGRTAANVEHFGRHANQSGLSLRPVARALLLCCAGTGAVLSWAMVPFAWSERRMLYRMLREIGPGYLMIADAGLFSYLMLSRLERFGSHALVRMPAGKTASKRRRRLGRGDHEEVWDRPRSVHSLFPKLLRREPEQLRVRVIKGVFRRKGYRDIKLRLATTLLNAPAEELLALYARRWGIELDIRELKRTHLPDVLRGLSPKSVLREFASGVLAFNVARALMARACAAAGGEVRRLSHTRACRMIAEYASRMRDVIAEHLPPMYRSLLSQLSRLEQPEQERPPEPRAIVPKRRRYPLLRTTRQEWRIKHVT